VMSPEAATSDEMTIKPNETIVRLVMELPGKYKTSP
jgi:hypothetical protein